MIGDSSGASMIVTWGDNTGVLQGESYKLFGLIVRTYCNKKYLSVPKENFTIACIDDIGEVHHDEEENERKMARVIIVGVKFFEIYHACYSCRGKITPTTDVLGECNRCTTTRRLDRCKMMASARMDVEADGVIQNLTCFSPILEEICDGEPSKAALLLCKPFNLAYSEKNVITSVTH